jgi:endonuclease/exonuclease/phosphatase family metal-dependent hydrolase
MKFETLFFCLFYFLIYHSVNAQSEKNLTGGHGKLKVMTYNVHHCNPPSVADRIDVEAVAQVIRNENPDLVALQEVDVNTVRSGKGKNQAQILAELTGMFFYFSKALDFQNGEYGVAVLSKFPILDTLSIGLSNDGSSKEENRTVAIATIMLPNEQRILFGSTHLGLTEQSRKVQSEKLVQTLKSNALPFILAGDFNTTPESRVISYLDGYFTRTCQSNCAPTIPVENPSKTIDYILTRNAAKLKLHRSFVIDEKYASDHLPVVAEFELIP